MDIFKILTKLFGSKSQRDIKAIKPIVDEILNIYPTIDALSNDDLRAKTRELKAIVQGTGDELRKEIDDLKNKIESTPIENREAIFTKIDKLEKEILERYEVKLNEVLPTAFAIVKSTCRRFKDSTDRFGNVLTATDFDREMAIRYPDVVRIDGDKALYDDDFEETDWNMDPYPCQLFGGVAIHQGKIAEMATGEGKTLTSTLPIYLNALTGNGVHVVTVNDYLAKRDARWNAPLYMFHELSVDCIDHHQPNSEARRRAYQADITYGTNNEFGFDYLRDNMAMSPKDLVQRMHNFAIVDEADSVLIDDARTPLIISGPVPKGDVQLYEQYQPLVEKLVGVQRQLATSLLTEAKKLIETGNKEQMEQGFLQLFRSHKALPKNKPLIKFLSEQGIKTGMIKTEEIYMENNNKRMPEAVAPLYFVTDEKMHSCDLTDKGTAWLAEQVGDDSLFVLPDITTEISALKGMGLPDAERIEREDALYADYAVKSERIHTIQQLLKAYSMFDLNVDYVVMDGQVKIVDEQTGRIMEGRRWSDGLHQAVEAKEHVKVEAATQTFATITLQNYFRMYHKISGMTGTASTEAGELWNIYKLDVVEIPTNMQWRDLNGPAHNRNDQNDRVYKTNREKYAAVIEEIIKEREAGRPTLVGTTSVEISELLSRMLRMRNIPHQVLNAKLHQAEADIVKNAGRSTDGKGAVTIATNMAGRGTDIKLSDEVKAAGGLAIIGTERHESRRVDRQLRGRAGRQGDPGSSVFFVSLEDQLMRLNGGEKISAVMDKLGFKEGELIEAPIVNKSIERAQKKVEENNFGIRKRLLEYDDVMNKQRTVIYEKRRHALMGERIGMDISNMIWDRCINIIEKSADYASCSDSFIEIMAMEAPFTESEYFNMKRDDLYEKTFEAAMAGFKRRTDRLAEIAMPVIKQVYEQQAHTYENILIPITDGRMVYNIRTNLQKAYETESKEVVKDFEKAILLHNIDDAWKENLRALDELKHAVRNASYEQKDPLLIFKLESVKLFDAMVDKINNATVATLMRAQIPVQAPQEVREAAPEPETPKQQYTTSHEGTDLQDQGMKEAAARDTREQQHRQPIVKDQLPGRNDPCPCGSGKKFKNCHGKGL